MRSTSNIITLSVLKAWVGIFLVKIDMLNCWLSFSNTQQCIDTICILWLEVYLVIKKKVATVWKTTHVSKGTTKGKPHPAITWCQKAQHLDIANSSLVPRPQGEEKGPGFSCLRMRLIAVEFHRLRILSIYFRTLVTPESILNVTLSVMYDSKVWHARNSLDCTHSAADLKL